METQTHPNTAARANGKSRILGILDLEAIRRRIESERQGLQKRLNQIVTDGKARREKLIQSPRRIATRVRDDLRGEIERRLSEIRRFTGTASQKDLDDLKQRLDAIAAGLPEEGGTAAAPRAPQARSKRAAANG